MSQKTEKSPIPNHAELTLAFTHPSLFNNYKVWLDRIKPIYTKKLSEMMTTHPQIKELCLEPMADLIFNLNLADSKNRNSAFHFSALYITIGWELHNENLNDAKQIIANCAAEAKHITRGNMMQRALITTLLQIGATIHNSDERRLAPFENFLRKIV